jgi:predicted tellurium resistance membrane protein TerC
MQSLEKIIEKINSIAILFIIVIFMFGAYLLLKSNNFITPSAIGGFFLLGFGLLYSIFAFTFTQIHENYKSIIKELQEVIKTWKSSARTFEKTQRDFLTSGAEKKGIAGEWQRKTEQETEEETSTI